ncbi:hypothetical protein GF371_04115 [Candidatus Woesearchaeota archaeon]|nr:hypothetical protein [Candidatus Woesearchaeota archaeon]
MTLPPAPNHNVRKCTDLADLFPMLQSIGDGEGLFVEDGKVAVAPFSRRKENTRARFLEKLVYTGQYRIIVNQPEEGPAVYIVNGENFVFTFELSETGNKGAWFLSGDDDPARMPDEPLKEKMRAYVAGLLGPQPMWAEHTQIRLYVNAPDDENSSYSRDRFK